MSLTEKDIEFAKSCFEDLHGLNSHEIKEWMDDPDHVNLLKEFAAIRAATTQRAVGNDLSSEYIRLQKTIRRARTKRYMIRWSGVAAILVIGLCLFLLTDSPVGPQMGSGEKNEKIQAVLTIADGKILQIRESMTGLDAENFQLRDSLKELVYEPGKDRDSLCYHRLDVPRAGEYTLILEDGSSVRMNSGSSIVFPANFSSSIREVEAYGELYFEIQKDSNRPFIVRTNNFKVEVLGTRFGIRTYEDEEVNSAVLVEGRVRIISGGTDLFLAPGEQACLANGKLYKREVDVEKKLAWLQGLFVFEYDELSYVVNQLTRWYDMDFRFENEALKNYRFSGTFSRDQGIDHILDLMERMNVIIFEKNEGYYLIKENDKVKI